MPRCNREGPGKHYDVRMPDWSEIHGRFSKHPWATVCLFLQAKTACTSKFIRHWRWWLTLPACIRQLHTFTTPRLTIHKSIRRWFGLLYLSKLPKLTDLNISLCNISDEGLSFVAVMGTLRELGIRSCWRVNEKGMMHLIGNIKVNA